MADLNWSIEKIVDCKGNDITTGGWVTISPMQGVGNTHASISVQPSEKYNDCETATVTISTGTGEKKYVTINRCNPQCNCDAIDFKPEVNIIPIGEDGGTVKVATYTMKYDCTDAYIGIVNTKSGCDYNIVNGTVYAVVGKNPSTTSDREFEYYVTYNGEKCNGGSQGGTYKGNFSQNKSIDKCEKENDCDNDISLDPEDFYVDYQGETKTISINASDCWEVRAQDVSYSDVIESITFNNDGTESYIKFLRNNTTSEDYIEGLVKYFFTNTVTGKECEKSITYSQYPNPNPPVDCDNCGVVYSDTLTVYNPIPYAYTQGGTKALAAFTVDSNCPKLSFWFAANPGSIIDQNKANKITAAQSGNKVTVLANYSPNGGSGSIINDNQTTAERSQEILCGVKGSSYPCLTIKLTQSGKPDTPTPGCECRISSFESTPNVDSNGKPTIRIFNLKDNGLCTSPNGAYIKYVFTGSYEGTTMVGCQYATLKTNAGLTIDVKDRSNPIVLAQGESITGTLSVYLSGCEDSTKSVENVVIGEQACSINVSCDFSNGGTLKGGLRYEVYGSGTEPITSYTLPNNYVIDTPVTIPIPEEYSSDEFTVKAKTIDSRYLKWNFDDATGVTCGSGAVIRVYRDNKLTIRACISEVSGQHTCYGTTRVIEPTEFTLKLSNIFNETVNPAASLSYKVNFNFYVTTCTDSSAHMVNGYYNFTGMTSNVISYINNNDPDFHIDTVGQYFALTNGSHRIVNVENVNISGYSYNREKDGYYNPNTHDLIKIEIIETIGQDCK